MLQRPGPVAALLPNGREIFIDFSLRHLPQELLLEISGHRPHFPGNAGVAVGQAAVAGAVSTMHRVCPEPGSTLDVTQASKPAGGQPSF